MLRDAVPGDMRRVSFFELKVGVAEQASGRDLDDPLPKILTAHARAVEVHQNGRDRPLDTHGMDRIVSRIAHRRGNVRQRVSGEGDEFNLEIAGGDNRRNAVVADMESVVGCLFERDKSVVSAEDAERR